MKTYYLSALSSLKRCSPNRLLPIVLFLCLGCTATEEHPAIGFLAQKHIQLSGDKRSVVLFLPLSGCSSCTDQALGFMAKNVGELADLYFVLITGGAREVKVGGRNGTIFSDSSHRHVVLDKLAAAKEKGLVSIYPRAYFFEGESLIKFLELDSSPSGYGSISAYLSGSAQ